MIPKSVNDIGQLNSLLLAELSRPGYRNRYDSEGALEVDVWKRVTGFASRLGLDPKRACLTSHGIHADRSAQAWQDFCRDDVGPDVTVLGSNNRLDIVLKHEVGSIGVEVKWLGKTGHSGKLTQGLGQALLGLAHRDRTVLVIHCGSVDSRQRDQLRRVGARICDGLKTALIVVP